MRAWLHRAVPAGSHGDGKRGGRWRLPGRYRHNKRITAAAPARAAHPRGAERMADQASPGPVASVGQEGGALAQPVPPSYQTPEPFHGRTVSWVAVSIIMAGFLAGGLGLIFGPTWWLFWVGVGASIVGGLLALGTHIFDDWY